MKPIAILVLFLCVIGAKASETVVKSSVPFSFPTVVGVTWKISSNGKDLSFVSQTRYSGKKFVEFSWSVPGATEKGSISIFNVAGLKIKTFPVASREGSVRWDVLADKKIGIGIYFAKLVCGVYKKNIKIAVY
ncbi:MAG: hypothetical protein WBM07_09295 [Chitinivibrionales bacterium]